MDALWIEWSCWNHFLSSISSSLSQRAFRSKIQTKNAAEHFTNELRWLFDWFSLKNSQVTHSEASIQTFVKIFDVFFKRTLYTWSIKKFLVPNFAPKKKKDLVYTWAGFPCKNENFSRMKWRNLYLISVSKNWEMSFSFWHIDFLLFCVFFFINFWKSCNGLRITLLVLVVEIVIHRVVSFQLRYLDIYAFEKKSFPQTVTVTIRSQVKKILEPRKKRKNCL